MSDGELADLVRCPSREVDACLHYLRAARVAIRVSQGGHDVAAEKLVARFPRTMANLAQAIRELPNVLIFDNNDLRTPFRQEAVFENGRLISSANPVPKWLRPVVKA